MDGRRKELGLRWADVAERGGITTQTLRGIRAGTRQPRGLTRAAIERALDWEPGSVDAILAGDKPTSVTQPVEGADVTPKHIPPSLLDEVVRARRYFGDDGAWWIIRAAFARPVDHEGHRESTTGGDSAAS